jgi:hypothetical protein
MSESTIKTATIADEDGLIGVMTLAFSAADAAKPR